MTLPSFDLTGRSALVTGAGRGLGRAIALALAHGGADVALGLRDETNDSGLVAEIEAMGRKALALPMDVMNLKQSYAAVDAAIAAFGKLDILVNNAGGGTEGPIEDFTEEEFDWTVDFVVKSTFFISQYVGRHMITRDKAGSIVNMGSQAGAIALPGEAIYCLSKAAVPNDKVLRRRMGQAQYKGELRCADILPHRRYRGRAGRSGLQGGRDRADRGAPPDRRAA